MIKGDSYRVSRIIDGDTIELENGIVDVGNYFQFSLAPKLQKVLDTTEFGVFEWESSWRNNRKGKFSETWIGAGVIAKFGLPPGSATFLLLNYYHI